MKADNKKESADEQNNFIQRLVALKRYEQPDPYFETRNLAVLREKLSGAAPGRGWANRWFGWLFNGSVPAFRMVVVSCLLALLSVNLLLLNSVPNLSPESVSPDEGVAVISSDSDMRLASTNESLDLYRKPVFVFEYPSNRQAVGPVQMGPSSVPVRYDY
ncbi:MAG: hypothetical protein M5U15_08245 [Kiritimatiellae bacterium]|nr:hypothetical protein [Kiritimatiellia bacterium]